MLLFFYGGRSRHSCARLLCFDMVSSSPAQVAMSARAWDKIDYSRVASVCMKNNKKHFEVRPMQHIMPAVPSCQLHITDPGHARAHLRSIAVAVILASQAALAAQKPCLSVTLLHDDSTVSLSLLSELLVRSSTTRTGSRSSWPT